MVRNQALGRAELRNIFYQYKVQSLETVAFRRTRLVFFCLFFYMGHMTLLHQPRKQKTA